MQTLSDTIPRTVYDPVFAKLQAIHLSMLNNVVKMGVLSGEPGCGKTLGMPLVMNDLRNKNDNRPILVTLPTILSVSNVKGFFDGKSNVPGMIVPTTAYVSSEHNIRPKNFDIMYGTVEAICRMFGSRETQFGQWSFIMIDEVHERQIFMDVFAGLLKMCAFDPLIWNRENRSRAPTLIMSSATNNPAFWFNFFQLPKDDRLRTTRRIHLSQPLHGATTLPVRNVTYLENLGYDLRFCKLEEPLFHIQLVDSIYEILKNNVISDYRWNNGSTLIFLPGKREIQEVEDRLMALSSSEQDFKLHIYQLHSELSSTEKKRANYAPVWEGNCYKVVLATNIAESSITPVNTRTVFNFGLQKLVRTDPDTNAKQLDLVWATKSQNTQRAGRIGRKDAGQCFQAYKTSFDENDNRQPVPEMQRVNLDEIILALKSFDEAYNVSEPYYNFLQHFVPSPPTLMVYQKSMQRLLMQGLVLPGKPVSTVYDLAVSHSGKLAAALPIPLESSRFLLTQMFFGFAEDAIVVAAQRAIDNKSLFKGRGMSTWMSKVAWANGHQSDDIVTKDVIDKFRVHQRNLLQSNIRKLDSLKSRRCAEQEAFMQAHNLRLGGRQPNNQYQERLDEMRCTAETEIRNMRKSQRMEESHDRERLALLPHDYSLKGQSLQHVNVTVVNDMEYIIEKIHEKLSRFLDIDLTTFVDRDAYNEKSQSPAANNEEKHYTPFERLFLRVGIAAAGGYQRWLVSQEPSMDEKKAMSEIAPSSHLPCLLFLKVDRQIDWNVNGADLQKLFLSPSGLAPTIISSGNHVVLHYENSVSPVETQATHFSVLANLQKSKIARMNCGWSDDDSAINFDYVETSSKVDAWLAKQETKKLVTRNLDLIQKYKHFKEKETFFNVTFSRSPEYMSVIFYADKPKYNELHKQLEEIEDKIHATANDLKCGSNVIAYNDFNDREETFLIHKFCRGIIVGEPKGTSNRWLVKYVDFGRTCLVEIHNIYRYVVDDCDYKLPYLFDVTTNPYMAVQLRVRGVKPHPIHGNGWGSFECLRNLQFVIRGRLKNTFRLINPTLDEVNGIIVCDDLIGKHFDEKAPGQLVSFKFEAMCKSCLVDASEVKMLENGDNSLFQRGTKTVPSFPLTCPTEEQQFAKSTSIVLQPVNPLEIKLFPSVVDLIPSFHVVIPAVESVNSVVLDRMKTAEQYQRLLVVAGQVTQYRKYTSVNFLTVMPQFPGIVGTLYLLLHPLVQLICHQGKSKKINVLGFAALEWVVENGNVKVDTKNAAVKEVMDVIYDEQDIENLKKLRMMINDNTCFNIVNPSRPPNTPSPFFDKKKTFKDLFKTFITKPRSLVSVSQRMKAQPVLDSIRSFQSPDIRPLQHLQELSQTFHSF